MSDAPSPPPQPTASGSDVKPRIGTLGSTSAAGVGEGAPVVMGSTLRRNEPPTGKPKLLFKPTVPVRRKKEEPAAVPIPPAGGFRGLERGRGRGRGERGRGRGGAGRGRGGARVEDPMGGMVASGPFAQGPSNIGKRSNVVRAGPGPSSSMGISGGTVSLPEDRKANMDDGEEYSDQEGGVEIVDMADMETLDVMAPRGLPKEVEKKKKAKPKKKVIKKSESSDEEDIVKPEPDDDATPSTVNSPAPAERKVRPKIAPKPRRHLDPDTEVESDDEPINMGQAVDAEGSDEEETYPDIRGDFIGWDGKEVPPNQLYFFQFPRQFPNFLPIPDEPEEDDSMDVDGLEKAGSSKKNVSFASDTKPGSSSKEASIKKEDSKAGILAAKKAAALPEGQIGTLLVMKSGKVKMRLGKDILLDVSAGSQLDFLQHFVHIDATRTKRATPIAKATRRFIVTPDVDELLDLLLAEDDLPTKEEPEMKAENEGLQAMDMSDDE